METQTFTAVLHKEEAGYVAECPEVGTASEGVTVEGAVAHLKQATQQYLEAHPEKTIRGRALLTTFTVTRN